MIRNALRRHAAAALMIAVAISVAACGGKKAKPDNTSPEKVSETMRERVWDVVKDEARVQDVFDHLDELDALFESEKRRRVEAQLDIIELDTDYDASEEDFNSAIGDELERRDDYVERVIAIRMAMREIITADEWAQLAEGQGE
jgi:hypothetical protein